jgi:hypothetical protein
VQGSGRPGQPYPKGPAVPPNDRGLLARLDALVALAADRHGLALLPDAMSANEVAWPTGMSDHDPAARDRPLVFNPQGFLVAILEDADQAEQAKATLVEAGFADRDLRV